MTNTFFERNTVGNWRDSHFQSEGPSKVRAKRAHSVAQIKISSSKFQHREVFDSTLYQKVNFFQLGMADLHKQEKGSQVKAFLAALRELANQLSIRNLANFGRNYCNLWGLIPETAQRDQVITSMTEALTQLVKKILEAYQQIAKSKQEVEQHLMRVQVDLKLGRKDHQRPPQVDRKPLLGRDQGDKKLKDRLLQMDFQLKKQILKSEQLQEQILEQGRQISELKGENATMQREKDQYVAYKEGMEFKVKRLKEELEVAHIIKEQNLADKMKYIMNW